MMNFCLHYHLKIYFWRQSNLFVFLLVWIELKLESFSLTRSIRSAPFPEFTSCAMSAVKVFSKECSKCSKVLLSTFLKGIRQESSAENRCRLTQRIFFSSHRVLTLDWIVWLQDAWMRRLVNVIFSVLSKIFTNQFCFSIWDSECQLHHRKDDVQLKPVQLPWTMTKQNVTQTLRRFKLETWLSSGWFR